jgi:hypothetical protein
MDMVSLRGKIRSWKQILSRVSGSNEKLVQLKGFYQDIITRQYWQQFGPSLAEECRSSFHSVFAFGKSIGWWRIALYLISYALVLALAIVLPLQLLTGWAAQYSGVDSCWPDGTFDLSADYDLWAVTGIFQITMGFGPLSFSTAKLLDAVWDVVSHQNRANDASTLTDSCAGGGSWVSSCVGSDSLQSDHKESRDVYGAGFHPNGDFRSCYLARLNLHSVLQAASEFSIRQEMAAPAQDSMDHTQHSIHRRLPNPSKRHDGLRASD